MGGGASSGLAAAIAAASTDDLSSALSGLSVESKAKLRKAVEAERHLKPENHLDQLTGHAKQEVAAMGRMSDEQTIEFFKTSDMMKRVMARTGMSLEDILNGDPIHGKCRHPIGKKLLDGAPLAIFNGCDAPDGPVYSLDGTCSTLHTSIKDSLGDCRFALLILGSQTCPMFMGKLKPLVDIIRPHMDSGFLSVLMVYIREAHPTDGWNMGEDSHLPQIAQTHTMLDRMTAAKQFRESAGELLTGISFWLDDPTTNALDVAYEAPPARVVGIDKEYKVVFSTGQAPLQYDLESLRAFLTTNLG